MSLPGFMLAQPLGYERFNMVSGRTYIGTAILLREVGKVEK